MPQHLPGFTLHPLAKAVSLVTVALTANALAQQDAEEDEQASGYIEELVVTATKREADLQDISQSIQAFTEEHIDRMSLRTMEDYARSLAGVSIVSTSPGRNELVFRGISTGSQEWRTDASAAVYLDEIPMTSPAQQADPYLMDIERIEALPGPQGTLFGSSSQSGTLRIVTNKPDTTALSGSVDIGFSALPGKGDASSRVEGHLNLPLAERAAVRVAAFAQNEGGFIDNVRGRALFTGDTNDDAVEDDFNTWQQSGFRVTGLWDVNESWSAQLMAIRQDSESKGDWVYDPAVGELEIVRFQKDIRTDDWWSTGLTVVGDLGFAELTIAAGHLEREVFYDFGNMVDDQLRTAIRGKGVGYDVPAYYASALYDIAYHIGTIVNDQIARRSSQEIRLASTGTGRLQWMMGAFYEETLDAWDWYWLTPDLVATPAWPALNGWAYYLAQSFDPNIVYPIAPTERFYGEDFKRETRQRAVFGEFGYDLTDDLAVGVGTRWFEYDRYRTERQYWPEGVPYGDYANNGIDTYDGKDSDIVYKVSAKYRIDNDKMVYFTYSEGFRLGGSNTLRRGSVLPRRFGPDKLFNTEIGVKTEWWENRLQLNLALYRMRWEDMQREINDPTLTEAKGHVNLGEAEGAGVEGSFTVWLTDALKVEGSLFKSSTEITEDFFFRQAFPNDRLPAGVADWRVLSNGQELAIAPDFKWWLGVEYTVPGVLFGSDGWIRYDHSFQAAQYHDFNDAREFVTKRIDDWRLANLQLGLWQGESGSWTLTFDVWNVWDERAINWVDTSNDDRLEAVGINRYRTLPGVVRPREFGISLRWDIGG